MCARRGRAGAVAAGHSVTGRLRGDGVSSSMWRHLLITACKGRGTLGMKVKRWIGATCLIMGLAHMTACGSGSPVEADLTEDLTAKLAELVHERNLEIPSHCVGSFAEAYIRHYYGPSIEAMDRAGITAADLSIDFQPVAESFVKAVDEVVKHSSDAIDPKKPDKAWTEICARVRTVFFKLPAAAKAGSLELPALAFPALDCGSTGDGASLVLCAGTGAFPDSAHFLAATIVAEAVPLTDPTYSHQYGFVFDGDDNASNNYVAGSSYPNDFFQDTDRWYVARASGRLVPRRLRRERRRHHPGVQRCPHRHSGADLDARGSRSRAHQRVRSSAHDDLHASGRLGAGSAPRVVSRRGAERG